jgi:hypothetical protein
MRRRRMASDTGPICRDSSGWRYRVCREGARAAAGFQVRVISCSRSQLSILSGLAAGLTSVPPRVGAADPNQAVENTADGKDALCV